MAVTKQLMYKLNSPSTTRSRELSESARSRELSESEGKLGRKQLLKQFIPDSAHGKKGIQHDFEESFK